MKSRIVHTRTGQFRVLGSQSAEPIVLPPVPAITAEEIWTARCELRRQRYNDALSEAFCPEGARLISLNSANRVFFAIIDEEDFEWLSRYEWRAWTRRGYKNVRAVTTINGQTCQMSRLVKHVGHRYLQLRNINGNPLDNRKSNLQILTAEDRRALHSCITSQQIACAHRGPSSRKARIR